jgi:hypothetical protein
MKNAFFKLTVFFIAILLTSSAYSQLEKGKWISTIGFYLDANIGKGNTAWKKEKTTDAGLSAQQGYFISKNVVVGIGYEYIENKRFSSSSDESYIKDKSYSHDVYLYGQYYKRITNRLYYSPLILIDYFKQKGTFRRKDPGFEEVVSTSDFDNYGLRINPTQFSFELTKKLLLETGLGYIIIGKRNGENVSPSYTETGNSTTFKMEFSPFITNIKISLVF